MRRFAITVLALLVATTACSDSKPPTTSSASAFNPFDTSASSGTAGPAATPAVLALGDCFNTDQFVPGAAIDPRGVHLVACTEPHQHEVYAIETDTDPTDASFPGEAAMSTFADDQCLADFEPALGVDYRQSALDFAATRPDANSWKDGDRTVICALHDSDFAELTGSRLVTTTTNPTTTNPTASLASESG